MTLEEQLRLHEAVRLIVYDDATGKPLKRGKKLIGFPTIGIGRNLLTNGLREEEAEYLLDNDIDTVSDDMRRVLPWAVGLSEIRYRVLIDMAFAMGTTGLYKWKSTLESIYLGEYAKAAASIRHSLFARQTGVRAKRLAFMMEKDRYPTEEEL